MEAEFVKHTYGFNEHTKIWVEALISHTMALTLQRPESRPSLGLEKLIITLGAVQGYLMVVV